VILDPDIHLRFARAARRFRRRLVARSWTLSRWHYRYHGLALTGRATDTAWYFAYGSNMHDSAFLERRRRMRPLEWRAGCLKGYRLRFNLDGRPRGRAAPANLCPDPDAEVWGVLYRITQGDMLRLNLTEGIPGGAYRPTWIIVDDIDGCPIEDIPMSRRETRSMAGRRCATFRCCAKARGNTVCRRRGYKC
jgi:hypothetical protein